MAAATQIETVTITVNDLELTVPKGELIVESVKRLGFEIPIFCYHPRMKPVGMCRMCIVEVGFKQPDGSVRKMPKPQAACTLPASEGMVVYTDTEAVHRDRKGVLEFLLVNHPLDCPICDRGGECPLQNNTLFYGPSTSRYVEIKRHLPKAYPLSKYVTLDLERCIQCGRCVRFTEEISGDSQLAFRFRGANMQPSTFGLMEFESKFSGNVIEICPVGALTSSKYRFRARPWDLQTRPAICTNCSNGCNVWMDYRVNKVVRINGRTNEAINEEWTCDRGKFGHDFYNSPDRLIVPLVRRGTALVETTWSEAYSDCIRAFTSSTNTAGLGGNANSNEDLFAWKKLFNERFNSNELDYSWTKVAPNADPSHAKPSIASIEDAPSILIFGSSLADELPIVFLRVRKAWFKNGAKVIVAHDQATDADSFAELVLNYQSGTEATLAQALADAKAGKSVEAAAKLTGVPAEKIAAAAAHLTSSTAIITSHELLNRPGAHDALGALKGLGELRNYALNANDQGAAEIGIGTGTKRSAQILADARDGKLDALWLLGVDPFEVCEDHDLVQAALENVAFLVVQAHTKNGAFPYASVVLPMTAPAEADGTYTNADRHIQRFGAVLPAKGEAKPAWKVFSEISLRLKPGRPWFNADEVGRALGAEVAAFANHSFDQLPTEGLPLV